MRSKIRISMMCMLLATLFIGCTEDITEVGGVVAPDIESSDAPEIGTPLELVVMDSRSDDSTRTLENYAATEFQEKDKIGLFIIVDGYVQRFNEPYEMNTQQTWVGDGAYWGDTNSGVYYFAYYPYQEDAFFLDYYYDNIAEFVKPDDWAYETYLDGFVPAADEYETEDGVDYPNYTIDPTTAKWYLDTDDIPENLDLTFFNNLIMNWQILVDQSGTGYTNSDLMLCEGYFDTTASYGQYPLVLKLAHQMSMMHFEFPEAYKFINLADGEDGTTLSEDGDATLSIAFNGVYLLSSNVASIDPISDIQSNFKDLSEDVGSIYEDGCNNFRYIMRPFEYTPAVAAATDVTSSLSIKYSYMEGGAQIDKTFNPSYLASKNSYVHYLMDDGQIPTGDPQQIRATSTYPTCVGAFWRYNEHGERIVKIQPAFEEDYGEWRAMVYKMDNNWDKDSDIRLSVELSGIDYNKTAEECPVEEIAQTVSGTCGANEPIIFRIGLTDTDFDMKDASNTYVPARYAVIMLIYGDGEKYQLLYLRQGEDPDYLFHTTNDTYQNDSGAYISRFYATKISPYNLTNSAFSSANNSTTTIVSAAAYNAQTTTTGNRSQFVDYPSKTGYYMQGCPWNGSYDSGMHLRQAMQAISTDKIVYGNAAEYTADTWDNKKGTVEVCPYNVLSANGTREFDYKRPNAGRTDTYILTYNGTISEFGQSLFDNPLGTATNCISGYYADGWHDRRSVLKTIYAKDYSSTGTLFYNSRDFGSVFFPAGNFKNGASAVFSAPASNVLPTCSTTGYYWTSTQITEKYYSYFKMHAPNDTSGDSYKRTITNGSGEVITEEAYADLSESAQEACTITGGVITSSNVYAEVLNNYLYYSVGFNLRPVVEEEREK